MPHHEPHFLRPPRAANVSLAKAEVGRYLFYDVRLSLNRTQSCASCHQQQLAFTDGRPHAVGSTGEEHRRNTMTLTNAAFRTPLTWADPKIHTLEQQVAVPLTNRDPIELGMRAHYDELLSRLRDDTTYRSLFARAFPDDSEPVSMKNVATAIASFERTMISSDAPYDRYVTLGDSEAISASAKRGMRLFFSERLGCNHCHGGTDFDAPADAKPFQKNGVTHGKFRVPTLRNVGVTAPYMHDGSVVTIEDVLDRYAKARKFAITVEEKTDLTAFLESLTDRTFLEDKRLANPWTR